MGFKRDRVGGAGGSNLLFFFLLLVVLFQFCDDKQCC